MLAILSAICLPLPFAPYSPARQVDMYGSAIADIRDSYGAALIGLILAAILYGVTLTQTWFYFWHYRSRDPMPLKGFITFLITLDALHIILCIYSVYWYLILNFGNLANLDVNMWAMTVQGVVNGLIGFLVQLFYARQIYIMSNSIILPAIIMVLGGLCFAVGFVFAIKTSVFHRYSRYNSLIWVTCTGMSTAALADILIALVMCWCLYHGRTGFPRTDFIITSLMSYSINSGLLTSILATSMLVSFVVRPSSFVSEVFFWLMGKCHVISFLAILNNRDSLQEPAYIDNSKPSFPMASIRKSKAPYRSKTGPTSVAVTVHRTTAADFSTSRHNDRYEPDLEKSSEIETSVHEVSHAVAI